MISAWCGLLCVGITRAWVCRQDGRATEARKSWALRPRSSEWTVYRRAFGESIDAQLNCHTVRLLKLLIALFRLPGRDSIVGLWLWLPCPQTQQKRRKLPSKMWVLKFNCWDIYFWQLLKLKSWRWFNCLSDEKPSKVIESCRMNVGDFQVVKVIGRGAFGEVQLVSHITTKLSGLFGTLLTVYSSLWAILLVKFILILQFFVCQLNFRSLPLHKRNFLC